MRFTQNPNLNGIHTIYDLGITLVILWNLCTYIFNFLWHIPVHIIIAKVSTE